MTNENASSLGDLDSKNRWDAEHDIFHIMLPDKNLTMIYHDNQFYGVDCSEYRVEWKNDFSGIVVHDPKGYLYSFTTPG